MKKVLVITLVLVMALASSAMAAVNFSGKFTATAEMSSFRVFSEPYTLTPGFTFTIGATNENKTDEVVNWDFTGGISLKDSKFELGKYKLGLYDNYFNAWAWGNGQDLTDKGTHFNLVKAGKTAAAGTMRARVEVPVLDLGAVTIDLTAPTSVRAFVDAEVAGFNVGVAYLRDWADPDNAFNVIAADADTAIPAGDLNVNLKAAAGVKLGTDLGFGLGFGADTMLTDELKLEGSVTHASEHWKADALTAGNTVLGAKATYTEDVFQVIADLGYTIIADEDTDNTNSITLSGKYRMSDALTYGNLFHADHWFKNTAPAFGAGVTFKNVAFDNVYVDVTSPVVESMVWVKGAAKYASKVVTASVLGHIVPFDKLTIIPFVEYKYDNSGAEAVGTPKVNLKANYKIGSSSTLLKFEAERVFVKDAPTSLLKLSVEVPF